MSSPSTGGADGDATPLVSAADLAPCLYGPAFDVFLLGVIGCQYVYWALRRERSEWYIRVYMHWTMLGSIAHSGFMQAFVWHIFIDQGDVDGWWIKGLCVFEIVLAGPVELIYAWRAFNLWGRPLWFRIVLPILFLNFFVVGSTILAVSSPDTASLLGSPLFLAWIVSYTVLECSLAALIVLALWQKRSGISTSDRLVLNIIFISAEAQLIPCVAAVAITIWVRTTPGSSWIFLFCCLPKLWVITCNLVINSRKRLRRHVETERERRQNALNSLPVLTADQGDDSELGASGAVIATGETGEKLLGGGAGATDHQHTSAPVVALPRWSDESESEKRHRERYRERERAGSGDSRAGVRAAAARGHTHSLPELDVRYPDEARKRSVNAHMSFEEMLQSGSSG